MKVPSNKAFNGGGFNDLLDADLELQGHAADHMLLLWYLSRPFQDSELAAANGRLGSTSSGMLLRVAELNKVYHFVCEVADAFGCPILPQDSRDKLRELYIAAARDLPRQVECICGGQRDVLSRVPRTSIRCPACDGPAQ